MSLTVRDNISASDWNQFINACEPHTFLQSWAWGEFHQMTGHAIHRLGVYDGDALVACALTLVVQAKRGSFLFVPHGPIVSVGVDVAPVMEALTNRLHELANEHHCVFIRVSPSLSDTAVNRQAFVALGFRSAPIHMHPERAWMLDVTPSEDELLRAMRKTTRYSIRKAETDGVDVRMSTDPNDVETFWVVYRATVDRQNFTPFSKEYLRKEFDAFAADGHAAWFFGTYQGDVISAAMVVFDKHSGYYHQGASIQQTHPKITASYLLQWRIIQEAKRRGCRTYNFWGISPDDRPKHPWAGLSLFKKGFGGHDESYLHAQDLVVSPRYWLSWVLETARRMKRGL